MMLESNFDLWVLLPALAAGFLALASHVPLGRQVLQRGIVFLDLAIAQLAGMGTLLAQQLAPEAAAGIMTLGGLSVALLGAVFLHAMERYAPKQQEALIGVVFVSVASLTLILISHDPQGSEQLQTLLGGQILWTRWQDLGPLASVAVLILLMRWRWPNLLTRFFYLIFALAITASVQIIGVYLVFASLIIPALSTLNETHGPHRHAYALGSAGLLTGLILSARLDWPAGAAIVIAMVGWGVMYWALHIHPRLDQENTPVER